MNLQQLISKATSDKKFFEQLKKDPAAALGSDATPKQVAALKNLNYDSLVDVGAAFGGPNFIT